MSGAGRKALVVGILAVALAACSGASETGTGASPAERPVVTATPTGPVAQRLLVHTRNEGTDGEVGVSGVLGVSESGCVTLGNTVVIASVGSHLTDGGRGVVLADGPHRLGDRVLLSGFSRDRLTGWKDRRFVPAGHALCGKGPWIYVGPT